MADKKITVQIACISKRAKLALFNILPSDQERGQQHSACLQNDREGGLVNRRLNAPPSMADTRTGFNRLQVSDVDSAC